MVGGTSYFMRGFSRCQYFSLNLFSIVWKKGERNMSEFEKAVKKALIDRDMTLQGLADALGITISYVSDLIKDKRKNELQIERIKQFLGLE